MINKKEKVNNKTKAKQFRLRGKKFFLTYSQLNLLDLNSGKNQILEKLEQKIPHKIIEYVVCEEKHEDGGTHYHIYLEFNQRVELFGSDCLDLDFDGINCHGSYETVRKKENALHYIVKKGNFIANPELMFIDGHLYTDFREYLTKLHRKGGISLVRQHLIKNPLLMVKGGSKVLKDLEMVDKIQHQEMVHQLEYESILPIEYFNFPPIVNEWYNSGAIESIVFYGPSGTGKTEGFKAWLKSKNIPFLIVRNIHGLMHYDPKIHKAVFFDDTHFEKPLTAEEHINLSDTANPTDTRILRNSIRIIQNTLRIFTTNNLEKLFEGVDLNSESGKAILSRYLLVNIKKSLFHDNIEIDIDIKIRNKERQKKVLKHNLDVLSEIKKEKEHALMQINPHLNPLIS
jgi:hypothetical protein